jgi:hypothetical protein
MEGAISRTLRALKKRGLKSWYAETGEEAVKSVLDMIPLDAVVGVSDSTTIRQLGVVKALRLRGNRAINPFDVTKVLKDQDSYFKFLFWPSLAASLCEVFLAGTNAVTEDGKIVNIDGAGNRVSGIIWGHRKSIIVVGKNKITKNLDEALARIKNSIVPEHTRRKGGSSPCTRTGRCHDCSGEHRVCAVTSIIEHKPMTTEINVVIVDEDLGLGWDKSWPEHRIKGIMERNARFVCPIPPSTAEKTDMAELWRMAKDKTGGVWLSGPGNDPGVEDKIG